MRNGNNTNNSNTYYVFLGYRIIIRIENIDQSFIFNRYLSLSAFVFYLNNLFYRKTKLILNFCMQKLITELEYLLKS